MYIYYMLSFIVLLLDKHYQIPSFFFNHTPTTEIYTLSLHDALPIFLLVGGQLEMGFDGDGRDHGVGRRRLARRRDRKSTRQLQSRLHLVCRLLLEKKKKSF